MDYLQLVRAKHYLKNAIIFIPMFFGGVIFNLEKGLNGIVGFVAFCMVSSVVYILNDYKDIERDRNHPTKRNRPLASGRVSKRDALVIAVVCSFIGAIAMVFLKNLYASLCLTLYLLLNVAYSLGLKNYPIIDVVILASGFVIRVFFGGFVTDVAISKWLYLVIVTGSLYMGLGKRRNELQKQSQTRDVLSRYSYSFLDKNMYVCIALTIVFYALWSIELHDGVMIWTVPLFMTILMCYSLDVEGDSDADPIEVILKDKVLLLLASAYVLVTFGILYF